MRRWWNRCREVSAYLILLAMWTGVPLCMFVLFAWTRGGWS